MVVEDQHQPHCVLLMAPPAFSDANSKKWATVELLKNITWIFDNIYIFLKYLSYVV